MNPSTNDKPRQPGSSQQQQASTNMFASTSTSHLPLSGPSNVNIPSSHRRGGGEQGGGGGGCPTFGQYPTLDKPFTNQLSHQTTFTPYGYSYDSPFTSQYMPDSNYDLSYLTSGTGMSSFQPNFSIPSAGLSTSSAQLGGWSGASAQPGGPSRTEKVSGVDGFANWAAGGFGSTGGAGNPEGSTSMPEPEPMKKSDPAMQYPATNIATGARFMELLEAKLGLNQAPLPSSAAPAVPQQISLPPTPSFGVVSPPMINLSNKFSPPPPVVPPPAPNMAPRVDALQIENTLLDGSQTTIPPEYVAAPFPADFFPWAMQNRQQALAMSGSLGNDGSQGVPQLVVPSQTFYPNPPGQSYTSASSSSPMGFSYTTSPSLPATNPSSSPLMASRVPFSILPTETPQFVPSSGLLQAPPMTYARSLPIPTASPSLSPMPLASALSGWSASPISLPASSNITIPNMPPASRNNTSPPALKMRIHTPEPPLPTRDVKKPKYSQKASISSSSKMSISAPMPVSAPQTAASGSSVSFPASIPPIGTTSSLSPPIVVPSGSSVPMPKGMAHNTMPSPRHSKVHLSPPLAAQVMGKHTTSPLAVAQAFGTPTPPLPGAIDLPRPSLAASDDDATMPMKKKRKASSVSAKTPGTSPQLLHARADSLDSARAQETASPMPLNNTGADDGERKIVIACHRCRSKKLKCDGVKPQCFHCARHDVQACVYDEVLKRRGPGKHNKKDKMKKAEQDEGSREVESTASAPGVSRTQVSASGSRFEVSETRD